MSKNQTAKKMPGKTILRSSIKLKSILKNTSTYNNKYSIKEQKTLIIKK